MKKTIGIIGHGFIGQSLIVGFKDHFAVRVYDIIPEKRDVESIEELVKLTDIIFVAVPTPMFIEDGQCDVRILEGILSKLNKICEKHSIIIKSTIPPNVAEEFEKKFKHLNIVANPEFLTERNAINDFLNQDRIILGGKLLGSVVEIYKEAFPNVPIFKTNLRTAFMVKYATNIYLAVKLSLANEFYEICEKLNISYDEMIGMTTLDKRIEKEYWKVPYNGKKFWAGHCWPKDLNSLMFLARQLDVETNTMEGAWKTNLQQPEEDIDWLKMDGRAISKKK